MASEATESTTKLAEALGVHPRTILVWMSDATPKHRRLVPDAWTRGGHARFTKRTIDRLVALSRKKRPPRAA